MDRAQGGTYVTEGSHIFSCSARPQWSISKWILGAKNLENFVSTYRANTSILKKGAEILNWLSEKNFSFFSFVIISHLFLVGVRDFNSRSRNSRKSRLTAMWVVFFRTGSRHPVLHCTRQLSKQNCARRSGHTGHLTCLIALFIRIRLNYGSYFYQG